MDNTRKKELIFIISIFFFAFILRIFYCFFFKENILYIQTHIFGDTQDYIRIAKNFLSGKGLISSPDSIAYRPPLYPLFLSGVYSLFGDGYWPIRIIQSILDAFSCVIVYFLGGRVLNELTGKIASFICTIYPFFIFFTGFELTETLFIFLLIGAVFIILKLKNSSIKNAILAGIVTGLTVLCRPSILLFVFLSFIVLFFCHSKTKWQKAGILTVFMILTIFPWSIRNFYHFRKFIPLTTMTGSSLWEGNNPYAKGGPCQYWPEEAQKLSEVERDKYLINASFKVIKENPLRFLKLLGVKFVRFWNVVPNYKGFSSLFYILVSIFSYIPIIITAVLGMFLTRGKWRDLAFLYSLFLSFTIIHVLFVSSVRYRVPIMPFIIIFSAYTLNWLYTKEFSFNEK